MLIPLSKDSKKDWETDIALYGLGLIWAKLYSERSLVLAGGILLP